MKIIIADDHALFRDALTHYIERSDPQAEIIQSPDFHGVMNSLATGDNVDLVLLDMRMPGMNGLQGLARLKKTYPSLPVALLSGLAEGADARSAMEMGACGYFPKTLPGKTMLQGVYKILQGEKFIPLDHNTGEIMPSYRTDMAMHATHRKGDVETLTQREKQVLGFLMRGASNKGIAEALGLQVVTIKLHVRGICRKLGVKNRTQAALCAQKINLLVH